MYYYEQLVDVTVIGLYDGTQDGGAIEERILWDHHSEVAKREHPRIRGHVFPETADEWPLRAIDHARIRTALISTYRVHSKKYFIGGVDFPETWKAHEAKLNGGERFSPPGTVGYYFGLTVDAAMDEAQFYSKYKVPIALDDSKLILVHRTYYEDLLYLTPALPAVWAYLNLPVMPVWEMYIAIMNPHTSNEITDAIGIWAREYGLKGIVFPSARCEQRLEPYNDNLKSDRFPALNFVEIGSHLCVDGVAIDLTLNGLALGLNQQLRRSGPPQIIFSEPNLVVFDESAVAGVDRPVFYATYNIYEADIVKKLDARFGVKHEIGYFFDEKETTLFVDDPKFKIIKQVPR